LGAIQEFDYLRNLVSQAGLCSMELAWLDPQIESHDLLC
jgi:hypothetical protein